MWVSTWIGLAQEKSRLFGLACTCFSVLEGLKQLRSFLTFPLCAANVLCFHLVHTMFYRLFHQNMGGGKYFPFPWQPATVRNCVCLGQQWDFRHRLEFVLECVLKC